MFIFLCLLEIVLQLRIQSSWGDVLWAPQRLCSHWCWLDCSTNVSTNLSAEAFGFLCLAAFCLAFLLTVQWGCEYLHCHWPWAIPIVPVFLSCVFQLCHCQGVFSFSGVASWVSKLHRRVKKIPRGNSRSFTVPLPHQANQKWETVKNKRGPSCQKESLSFWQLSMRKHEVCLHFWFSEGLHVLATNSFTGVEGYLALSVS